MKTINGVPEYSGALVSVYIIMCCTLHVQFVQLMLQMYLHIIFCSNPLGCYQKSCAERGHPQPMEGVYPLLCPPGTTHSANICLP